MVSIRNTYVVRIGHFSHTHIHSWRKKIMKIPITLTINQSKKLLVELTRDIHGKTFSDILDMGLDAFLQQEAPLALIDIQIAQHRERILELEHMRAKASIAEEQIMACKQAVNPSQKDEKADTYLQNLRMQKFNDSKNSILKLWKKGDMNWNRIVETYQFRNVAEAKDWFAKTIIEIESGVEA